MTKKLEPIFEDNTGKKIKVVYHLYNEYAYTDLDEAFEREKKINEIIGEQIEEDSLISSSGCGSGGNRNVQWTLIKKEQALEAFNKIKNSDIHCIRAVVKETSNGFDIITSNYSKKELKNMKFYSGEPFAGVATTGMF